MVGGIRGQGDSGDRIEGHNSWERFPLGSGFERIARPTDEGPFTWDILMVWRVIWRVGGTRGTYGKLPRHLLSMPEVRRDFRDVPSKFKPSANSSLLAANKWTTLGIVCNVHLLH